VNRSVLQAGDPGLGTAQRALELAYRFLARRERTVSEVHVHLLGHDIDEASAAAAVEELIEQGSLDDARFARVFVQDKRALEQWGSERIRRGLLVRGIDRELADATLASGNASGDAAGEQTSELERALHVLCRRFPAPPRGRRERERALGLLLRKGYEPELAVEALRIHGRGEA
jgi:regulatory protein